MKIFFHKGLTKFRKSEIPPSEFCSICGDWGKLWIPNLTRMFLIECYWMLQNSSVTAFTDFELLSENQLEEGGRKITVPPLRIGLNQPHVLSTSWKYSSSWRSFPNMDETWNHLIYKWLKFKKGQTETNTCSKFIVEALEAVEKYVQI